MGSSLNPARRSAHHNASKPRRLPEAGWLPPPHFVVRRTGLSQRGARKGTWIGSSPRTLKTRMRQRPILICMAFSALGLASISCGVFEIWLETPGEGTASPETGDLRLTQHPAGDRQPAWSPDGRWIAFVSDRQGNDDLYLMATSCLSSTEGEPSNTAAKCEETILQLTDLPGIDSSPVWSPIGGRIAFSTLREENQDIFILDVACEPPPSGDELQPGGTQPGPDEEVRCAGDLRRLTQDPAPDGSPSWSPDGRRIAFISKRESSNDLYVIDVDGGGLIRLTDDRGEERDPAWSPDGSRIAFVSSRDGNFEIYVIPAPPTGSSGGQEDLSAMLGPEVRRLTGHPASDFSPTWSPDGSRIAFEALRGDEWEIYTIEVDCEDQPEPCETTVSNVTTNSAFDSSPAWSPDGGAIAFMSFRESNWDLYLTFLDN